MQKLGKVRAAVFPIENAELRKFLMMSGMMFFIIYIYTTVRDTKDTLIVSSCGAEAITFLKVRVKEARDPPRERGMGPDLWIEGARLGRLLPPFHRILSRTHRLGCQISLPLPLT